MNTVHPNYNYENLVPYQGLLDGGTCDHAL
jgi:hypothetical protein